MDRETWQTAVHGITKSRTRLSDFTFTMSIESVMPSSHLILCCPLLLPILWNPTDCSLQDSSIHGILQARILEWVAISSRDLPDVRSNLDLLHCRWILYPWANQVLTSSLFLVALTYIFIVTYTVFSYDHLPIHMSYFLSCLCRAFARLLQRLFVFYSWIMQEM